MVRATTPIGADDRHARTGMGSGFARAVETMRDIVGEVGRMRREARRRFPHLDL